ncbi:MAG: M24 family metallopeptidase, partial [Candidatus Sungbacteria bacterium]|nr:M24 family metallopeptidase [Candidatus Sungbacteria bacterium]
GISTKALDDLGERLIRETGGDPVFKGYRALGSKSAYPCSLCTSINDEVVHAIPSENRILKDGDIIGLDIGMRWPADKKSFLGPNDKRRILSNEPRGLITDMAVTVGVGKISITAEALTLTTREALEKGLEILRAGIRLGDVGSVIQSHIEHSGYGVIRDLAGHGVGRELHESPFVPNYGRRGSGPFVHEGEVLAVEPMATVGDFRIRLDKDGWTFRTIDGGLAAHFEHTVLVTKDGVEVLTELP